MGRDRGKRKEKKTSLMELVFNLGKLFTEGFLSPRPASLYWSETKKDNSFSGIHGSDEIKRLKEASQFETFIQCMYIYTGNVCLCVCLIGKKCVCLSNV